MIPLFFYGGSNGEILALTQTCAHYVNINNFLGLSLQEECVLSLAVFPVLCHLGEIAEQTDIGACT
jgi:hypothetical protein